MLVDWKAKQAQRDREFAGLGIRCRNYLKNHGFETAAEARAALGSGEGLPFSGNFGLKSQRELKAWLSLEGEVDLQDHVARQVAQEKLDRALAERARLDEKIAGLQAELSGLSEPATDGGA